MSPRIKDFLDVLGSGGLSLLVSPKTPATESSAVVSSDATATGGYAETGQTIPHEDYGLVFTKQGSHH